MGAPVSIADVTAVLRQLRRRPGWVIGRFVPGKHRRIVDAWSQNATAPVHFYDVPAIVRRRASLATGDPDVSIAEYVAGKYLGQNLAAVSIGCGGGSKEAAWVATGKFAKLTCFDVSESRIEQARRSYPHRALEFMVADAYGLAFPDASLDVVIFEDSLHHLAPVKTILERCHRWVKPGGYVIANEYVGPRKLQWTRRQVQAADALLALIPDHLRVSYQHKTVKRRVHRPSLLRMRLLDPSEAIESDLIQPNLRTLFSLLEERQLGGTLVNVALDDIAHHFVSGEDDWLELMFSIEDALIGAGELESDYKLFVARR